MMPVTAFEHNIKMDFRECRVETARRVGDLTTTALSIPSFADLGG